MRINLVTPFAEKDAAKALGARWDSAKKVWYITDVTDLTPFARWIPDMNAATADNAGTAPAPVSAGPQTRAARPVAHKSAVGGAVTTRPKTVVPHCGCDVLPWVDCEHTAAPA